MFCAAKTRLCKLFHKVSKLWLWAFDCRKIAHLYISPYQEDSWGAFLLKRYSLDLILTLNLFEIASACPQYTDVNLNKGVAQDD